MKIFDAVGSFFSTLFKKAENSDTVQGVVHSQLSSANIWVLALLAGGLLWLTKGILSDIHQDMIFKACIIYMGINGAIQVTLIIANAVVKCVETKVFGANGLDDNEVKVLNDK